MYSEKTKKAILAVVLILAIVLFGAIIYKNFKKSPPEENQQQTEIPSKVYTVDGTVKAIDGSKYTLEIAGSGQSQELMLNSDIPVRVLTTKNGKNSLVSGTLTQIKVGSYISVYASEKIDHSDQKFNAIDILKP